MMKSKPLTWGAACLLTGALVWWALPKGQPAKNGPLAKSHLQGSDGVGSLSPSGRQGTAIKGNPIVQWMSDFMTPIAFYGKVIDQHGAAVDGATVTLNPNDSPLGGKTSEYHRVADKSGLFSIHGIHGITLSVSVNKAGYYQIPPNGNELASGGLFNFGLSREDHRGHNRNEPAVFMLHKSEVLEPLLKIGETLIRLDRAGGVKRMALNTGNRKSAEQVVIRCWSRDFPREANRRQYDWRLEMSVPSGGVAARGSAFDFVAPEEGYQESVVIDMPETLPQDQWRSSVKRSLFLKFSNGTFGRVDLDIDVLEQPSVFWKSYLNTKVGSRNLEADPQGR